MDHFHYRDGRLAAEEVPVERIAEALGTPFYCYAAATIERHFRVFSEAFGDTDPLICYAVKANSNIAVIATMARLGAGADVVSGGELKRALAAGVPASRIVFSGIGKTQEEMAAALKAGILQINVESEGEMDDLAAVAAELGQAAPVAIRVNPNVDARTHEKITTGKVENKFGIDWTRARAVFARAAEIPALKPVGLAVHIGSQVTEAAPFRAAFARLADMADQLRADGHAIETLDLGGGLGIPYADETVLSPGEYADAVASALGGQEARLILEPGRVIVGNAGVLVTRVIMVKEGMSRTFCIVDAAMNDLLRPTLYGARHTIVPVTQIAAGAPVREMEVVGPVCETGDTFGEAPLPAALKPGDLLVIRSAGAYGAVQSSTYNSRPLIPEVLVRGGDFAVVRERITVDDMLAREPLPPWLGLRSVEETGT
jgi:diaminopimelate decarboxylase